jgi:hypothetical protein
MGAWVVINARWYYDAGIQAVGLKQVAAISYSALQRPNCRCARAAAIAKYKGRHQWFDARSGISQTEPQPVAGWLQQRAVSPPICTPWNEAPAEVDDIPVMHTLPILLRRKSTRAPTDYEAREGIPM